MGVWEGKTWAELERLDSEMLMNFNRRPHLFRVEGAETFEAVKNRMLEGIFTIARECPDMTVAATSHGMATRILLGALDGLSMEEIGETRHGDNTSVSKLLIDGDKVTVEYRHDNSHLPPHLSTMARQTWHKSKTAAEPGLWYKTSSETPESRRLTAFLVEEEAGQVAFHREGDAMCITDFSLRESARGHRYGAALLGQAVQFARGLGLPTVSVICPDSLVPYFAQFGFVSTGSGAMTLDIRPIIRDIPTPKE